MKVRLPYLGEQSGFTLVELIITATYVAAASGAIVGIFVAINKLNKQARNLSVATALAEQEVETDRDAGYSAITASHDFSSQLPANFGLPKSAIATFTDLNPVQPGLKQLNVVLIWQEDGVTKHVQMSTLIAQHGIDR